MLATKTPTTELEAPWEAWKDHWALKPGVVMLNHGSLGPSPKKVQQERSWIRVSCHLYTSTSDIDALTKALENEGAI